MKYRVLFLLLVILLTMIAINLQGQTGIDPVSEAWDISPTQIYGWTLGTMAFILLSMGGGFAWIFRKVWGLYEKKDTVRTGILESLLEETKTTNKKIDVLVEIQTEHGQKITHIDTKVNDIDGRVKGVEKALETVKQDVEKLKPGKQ